QPPDLVCHALLQLGWTDTIECFSSRALNHFLGDCEARLGLLDRGARRTRTVERMPAEGQLGSSVGPRSATHERADVGSSLSPWTSLNARAVFLGVKIFEAYVTATRLHDVGGIRPTWSRDLYGLDDRLAWQASLLDECAPYLCTRHVARARYGSLQCL